MKILVAGDFCPYDRVQNLIDENHFEDVLGDVSHLIRSADYSLVNFECPVVDKKELAVPIPKCGPNLSCTDKGVEALKFVGFKAVTLANNHVLDYGAIGLNSTIEKCKEIGLDFLGVGINKQDAKKILYKNIEGKQIAFINCCEHEFSIATDSDPGANPLNPIQQFYDIQEARKNADWVFVIVHGGHEYYPLPSPRMKEIYRYFIDCGADAVINHHQHCYSGYEIYKDRPIFYGLGNFCFDNKNHHTGIWTEGYIVEFLITNSITFNIIPYIQCADEPKVLLMNEDKKASFFKDINRLNLIISKNELLRSEFLDWMNKTEKGYKILFSPYSNRFLKSLVFRGMLPSFLAKSKVLAFINYIECESHRDRILNYLHNKIK